MNATTIKLLFLLGVVSSVLLNVSARAVAVEQPWEVDDYNDETFLDIADGYDREVRQPLRYGRRRTLDKLSDVTKEHFEPPPYFQNSQHGRK